MLAAPLAHRRYRLEDALGEGGAGTVYRAHDVELDRRVALKVLHSLGAEDILRLKQEFRSLAELTHPNLVELYDLVADGALWFFTMELIEGHDFVAAFRGDAGSPGVDYDSLRDAIRQLVSALGALHGQGKLHRDIKPTNVLVDRAGRVVLVDFGLVTNHRPHNLRDTEDGLFAGTLDYMAPEQVWGQPLPASDWYGVGAMLYETLTGRPPYRNGEAAVLHGGGAQIPSSPKDIAPDTPADLDELVMALLRRRPEERPDPVQTVARLAASRRPGTREASAASTPGTAFVGRTEELARLERAFAASAGRRLVVTIEGASGMGKTALAEHFLCMLESDRRNLVLRARCHPRESVPFKAVDGLVDDLTRFLSLEPAESLASFLPDGSAVLPLLFPVFGRVCPQAPAPAGEPHEVRRAAFAALRALLGRVADRQRTVVWIDDLQWGDLDSAALLHELIRDPDPPRVLFVLAFRGEVRAGQELLRELSLALGAADDEVIDRLDLSPLPEDDARRLAAALVGDAANAAELAAESGGNPLIVGELARHHVTAGGADGEATPVRFTEVIATRIGRLPITSRRLLNLVWIAGEPMTERLLYRLAKPTREVLEAVSELRRQCLLRTAIHGGEGAFETYHHRIGETVGALLGPERARALHREVAATLEGLPDANPQQLVEHYFRAGDLGRAAEYAHASAEKAVAAMAFHGAARLYRRALELGTTACPSWELHAKLGNALISAGRSGEGAAALATAARERARQPSGYIEALRLRRRAAEYYLRGGLHAEGLTALRGVLSATGLRYARSPTTALLSLIGNRMRVGVRRRLQLPRSGMPLSPFERERLEACWSAGVGLSLFDQMRAAAFQVRHALLAHRAGDTDHLARALATEGFILSWEGGARKRRRAQQLRRAGERLARRADDPNIRAHGVLMSAVSAYYELRLRDALELCVEGERLCREECVGAIWELANFQVLKGNTLACLGDLPRLRAHLPEMLRQARERDDRYCLVIARLGYNNMFWLVSDRPREARQQADEALAGPFPRTFAWQLYQGAIAQVQIELYGGDGAAGWARMVEAWSTLRRHMMLRFQTPRVELRYLWARCALLRAQREYGSERQRMLRFVVRSVRAIQGEDAAWVRPFVDLLRAGVGSLRGRRADAVRRFEDAALGFDELGMALHASAARYQASRPCDESQHARETAWMRARGVVDPARMAGMLAPVA